MDELPRLRPIAIKERRSVLFLKYGQLDVQDGAFVLVNENGVRFNQWIVRLKAVKGESHVRVFHTFVVTEDSASKRLSDIGLELPLVVRLEGNNVEAGKKTLDASGLSLVSGDSMADAAQKIVNLVD